MKLSGLMKMKMKNESSEYLYLTEAVDAPISLLLASFPAGLST